jgi:ATP-dependent helicase/DNAse subunit B
MIPIFYFRSSSYNTWDNCEAQFYLQYTLGMDNPATIAATRGNVVHKALECIAHHKLCIQEGKTSFIDDNLGELTLKDCDPDNLIKLSFDWHRKRFDHNWNDRKDLKDCTTWMHMALDFNNGLFDPRKRFIVTPELKFDFEIDKPWASYEYNLAGKSIRGKLALKGTIDLVTKVRPGILEIIDWKTGASRNDFATGKEKNFESFHTDPQLRLYHYAAHHVYPEINDIIMTIFYIRNGGPFSLMLSKDDLPETEEIIRKQFEKVKNTKRPRLNPGPPWSDNPKPALASFKCFKLCSFSKPSEEDPTRSVCELFKDKIQTEGIDKVNDKYINPDTLSVYGDGGGAYLEK